MVSQTERRMRVHQIATLEDRLDHLRANPAEIALLSKELPARGFGGNGNCGHAPPGSYHSLALAGQVAHSRAGLTHTAAGAASLPWSRCRA